MEEYGSLGRALLVFEALPKAIRERLEAIKVHVNYNQVYDFYQRFGQTETLKALDEDERRAILHHGANDKFTMYDCGHSHHDFQEAQRCPRWQLIARGEKPKAERIIKNR